MAAIVRSQQLAFCVLRISSPGILFNHFPQPNCIAGHQGATLTSGQRTSATSSSRIVLPEKQNAK